MTSNTNKYLPLDWEYKKLGDICKTTSGGTPTKSNQKYYENGTIPWLGSGEIKHRHITKYKNKITELALKESSAKIIKKGSLLLAMYGATVGEVGILTFDSSTNQAVCSIFENDNINQIYLYFYFISIKQQLKDMSFGAGQQNISQTVIKNLDIPVPPLATQERIANILDKIQTLITQYQQQLQAYDNLIISQFYTLFGDPINNPKKHPVKKLHDIATVKKGKTITQANSTHGNIPVIAGGMSVAYYHNQSNITGESITISSSGANAGHVWFHNYPIWASDCTVIQSSINMNMTYLHYVILNLSPKIINMRHGAAQPHVYPKQIAELDIIILPLSEQEKFSQFVERIEILKSQTTNKLTQAQELFKSTSQQAFKGNLY